MRIGDQEFDVSRYPAHGDTRTVIFTLTPHEFAQIGKGDAMTVYYGRDSGARGWNFGPIDKDLLR